MASNVKIEAQCYIITQRDAGQRIDNFLLKTLKGLPRSRIYHLLRKRAIKVNQKKTAVSYRLQVDDRITVPAWSCLQSVNVPPSSSDCRRLSACILLENEHLIILDKPSGMAVHKGSGIAYGVIEVMRALRPDGDDLSLVHRLDRDTSGCLLLAKHRAVLSALHALFRNHLVHKRYQTLLCGSWSGKNKKTVHVHLTKNRLRSGERIVRVTESGKESHTTFIPLRRYKHMTYAEIILDTGRMHQIRVHAQHMGCPIAGDRKYGDKVHNRYLSSIGLNRLFLHASSIAFSLPDFDLEMRVEAPLPPALQSVLEKVD